MAGDPDPNDAIDVDAAPLDDEEEGETVIITDEDGNNTGYLFLATVEVEGNEYALLTPLNDPAEDDETVPLEIYLYRYEVDEDELETFSVIEDEETFAKVQAEAEALFEAERVNGDEDIC